MHNSYAVCDGQKNFYPSAWRLLKVIKKKESELHLYQLIRKIRW